MAKRSVPLFIIDRSRRHKLGECDFVVCTDLDCGFIARVDYVDGEREEVGPDYRVGLSRNGLSAKISIIRSTGMRPTETATRSLLKRAMAYYGEMATVGINFAEPSTEDCLNFIDLTIKGNMQYLSEGTTQERQRITRSINVMEAIARKLRENRW